MEYCDKCGKGIEEFDKSVLDDGIYHSECIRELLGIYVSDDKA